MVDVMKTGQEREKKLTEKKQAEPQGYVGSQPKKSNIFVGGVPKGEEKEGRVKTVLKN